MGKRITAEYLRQADLTMEQLDVLVRRMVSPTVLMDYYMPALEKAAAGYRRALATAQAARKEAVARRETRDRESAIRVHQGYTQALDEAEATYRKAVTAAVWNALEREEARREASS